MLDDFEYKQDFEIELAREVEEKIRWLTQNYEKEISAWLGGEIVGNKIIIDDFLIPFQTVGYSSIDTDGKQLIKLRKEYGDRCLRIIGHFHSHNCMSADWSGVDDDFIDKYMQGRDLRVFLVSSIDDGIKARLELRNPIKISLDRLRINVRYVNEEIEKELKEMIEKKVVESQVVVSVKSKYSSAWWDEKERQEEKEDLGEIKINKKDWSVELRETTKEIIEKLDSYFVWDEEIETHPSGKITIRYLVGNKKDARKTKKEINEILDLVRELNETREDLREEKTQVYNSEEWEDGL